MKLINISIGKILLILLCVFSLTIKAQKLPNKQEKSVWAPANIKIDGKADEWEDKYQAYNNATDIFYTVSNDDQNIYLTIKIKNLLVMTKIVKGGVSFTINHTVKKKDDFPITVTYPVLKSGDANSISSLVNIKAGVHNKVTGIDNSFESLNNAFTTKSKVLNVHGIKDIDISDDEMSIYNDKGIKAASRFDKPLAYIYELAIPLKYLALPNNGTDAFSYHIKLNVKDTEINFDTAVPVNLAHADLPPPPPPATISIAATDFWGEYTLAKKP